MLKACGGLDVPRASSFGNNLITGEPILDFEGSSGKILRVRSVAGGVVMGGQFPRSECDRRRMATLAPGGRISTQVVDEEASRLSRAWHKPETPQHNDELGPFLSPRQLEEILLFDRAQLAFVIDVCKRSRSLSEAGRTLFSASRARKSMSKDEPNETSNIDTNDGCKLPRNLSRFAASSVSVVQQITIVL